MNFFLPVHCNGIPLQSLDTTYFLSIHSREYSRQSLEAYFSFLESMRGTAHDRRTRFFPSYAFKAPPPTISGYNLFPFYTFTGVLPTISGEEDFLPGEHARYRACLYKPNLSLPIYCHPYGHESLAKKISLQTSMTRMRHAL